MEAALSRAVCFRECSLGEPPLYTHAISACIGSYTPENKLRLQFFQALFVTPKNKLEDLACDTIQGKISSLDILPWVEKALADILFKRVTNDGLLKVQLYTVEFHLLGQ